MTGDSGNVTADSGNSPEIGHDKTESAVTIARNERSRSNGISGHVRPEYAERFHPLGYKGAFGYRLRYFIRSGSLRLGCALLAGAAKAIAVRDRWIGWSSGARLRNLPQVINNSRFLIFPHVQVPQLASHVLGQLARRVVADWQRHWGFAPVLMETFVDPRHYAGTCYRAAGWELLGKTSGRGLIRAGKAYQTTPRLVWVKPLAGEFRRVLCAPTSAGG